VKGVLGVVEKPLSESDLIEFIYFTMFRAKAWKLLNFEWILLLENSNQNLQKLGFGRKNQL
jgi:hypothetical protein